MSLPASQVGEPTLLERFWAKPSSEVTIIFLLPESPMRGGILGIMLAVIFAAAMSTFSSEIQFAGQCDDHRLLQALCETRSERCSLFVASRE